jgi:hypothetical protein
MTMRLEDIPDSVCPHCRQPFESWRMDHKYCSAACRIAARRKFMGEVIAEERRRARAGRQCRYCGKPFEAKRRDQVFCCRRCGQAHRYELERGYRPAEAHAAMRCQCCGEPIIGAVKTDTRYCPTCRHAKKNEASRLYKRRVRAK